jgi:transposase
MPSSVRVYVAAQPTDLRKSFDGLSALVAETFGQDPLCGHLFVFRNRRGDQIRVLFWDRTGYAILGKKLASGGDAPGGRGGGAVVDARRNRLDGRGAAQALASGEKDERRGTAE